MKKIYLLFAAFLVATSSFSQITISGATGTANGTYTSLTNAGGAFTALNTAGSHTAGDNILISITADVTTEGGTTSLNSGTWATVTVNPAGSRIISGSVAAPLINLNGASNVTINGLNDGANSLVLSNASTSSTAGTCTIRFINDAVNNTVTNCTILGSTTGTAAQTGTASSPAAATILFGNSTGANGNDNNTISNNTIAEAGANLPVVAISSAGQSTAISNDNNTISGNNIANVYGANGANGIAIGSNSSAFTISNNKFYQTASRTGLASGSYWEAVFISTASGGGYTISNNTIGYAASAGTGMFTNNGGRLVGIDLTAVAAAPVSNIDGNTINGINWTTASGAATAGAAVFNPIIVKAGGVNIGTTTGNMIGAASGTGSSTANIFVVSTTTGTGIVGIYVTSATAATIVNNTMGAIATSGTAAIGFSFTGIAVAGSGSHTINSNTIGNATANNISIGISGTTTASTSALGITSAATGTTVSIGNTSGTGNTIQNISSLGSSTSSGFTGIQNTGAAGTVNINYNSFTANTLAGGGSTSSTIYYANITNSGATTAALNINNNTVNSAIISAASFGGTSGFIFGLAGGGSSAISIQNNIFTGFTFTGSTGSTGPFYGIYHTVTASVASKNVSNNAFNNLTLKSSGQVILVYVNDVTANMTVSGNSIGTQFSRTVSSGSGLYGIYSANSTGATSGTHVISNNNLSNITATTTSTATTGVVGIIWEPGNSATSSPTVTISGNTIVNYNNSSTAPMTGIIADWSVNLTISGNTIGDLQTGGAAVTGIQSSVIGTTSNIFKNKIYNLSTTSTSGIVKGMQTITASSSASPAAYNIYNNYIGNLFAPNSSGTNQVMGISIDGGSAARTHNLYYNTIYLNASGGANFGTSAIYSTITPTIRLSNNILVNTSTPSGTGTTVVYRRSAGAAGNLSTYAAASNNNLFYAGTPGTTRLIYADGTSTATTLTAYISGAFTAGTIAPRDALSVTENPPFLSTTGSNANFLHIDPAVGTMIENGALPITGYTDDFDGDVRNITTPDIGADEGSFTPASNMVYVSSTTTQTNVANVNTNSASQQVIGIEVVTSGSLNPLSVTGFTLNTNGTTNTGDITNAKIFYTGNSSTFATATQYGSTVASPAGSYTITGTMSLSQGTNYFWLTYDIPCSATAGNSIDAECTDITVGTVQVPSITNPGTGRVIAIGQLSGAYTVGSGGNYPNLTTAAAAINASGLSGNTTLTILNNLTEPGAVTINQWAECGVGGYSLLIKPDAGVTATVTGTVNSSGLIKIFAKNVTIDGSNNGTASRDLTITNTSTTGPSVVHIGSAGVTPVTNVMVKNSILINGANSGTALLVSDAATPGSAGYFNNITIQNNSIQKALNGIFAIATVAAGNGSGLLITGNDMTTTGANSIRVCGVYVQGVDGVTVSNNSIGNISNANAENVRAIWFATGTNNGTISGNTVSNVTLTNTGAFAVAGIYVTAGAGVTSITVTNNTVRNLTNSGTSASFGGILFTTPNTTISNNTISNMLQNAGVAAWGIIASGTSNSTISGNSISGITSPASSATTHGINIQGASTGVNIFNNRISNIKHTHTGGYSAIGLSLASTSTTANITAQNNFIWDVAGYGFSSQTTDNGYGINIFSGGGYKLYYNTVEMGTNQVEASGVPACLIINSAVTTAASIDIRNNIFSHSATSGANRYAILSNAASTVFSAIDYNVYYSSGSNLGYIGGSNRAALGNMQSGFGGNLNSVNVRPVFISVSDLHLVTNANCGIDGKGNNTGILLADDIDGTGVRNIVTPFTTDIGADEFTGNFILAVTNPPASCSVDLTAAAVTSGSSTGSIFSYWEDAAATTPIQAIHGTANAITTSGTYYIKSVQGSCSDIKAVTVTVTSVAGNAALATNSTNATILPQSCTDVSGWTYYTDPSDPTKILFGINWDPGNTGANASAKALATPTLQVEGSVFGLDDGALQGTWVMNRYWNVNLNGGVMTGPVNLRFFYDPAEKSATDAAAVNFQAAHPGSSIEPPTWFKTVGTDYANDAVHLNYQKVHNAISLTDVSGGATLNGVTYAQFDGITSFSGGTYASGVGGSTPLPINMVYFRGSKQGSTHSLTWKINCGNSPRATMTLERSGDGRSYAPVYNITADAVRCLDAFFYDDIHPLPGVNYYRVKSVDADGKITYSTIVTLLNKAKGFEIVNIAPNPTLNGRFKLNISTTAKTTMEVVIVDMAGRIVSRKAVSLIRGFNAIDMEVNNLASGTYQLYGNTSEGKTTTISFVKQ